MIEIENYPLPLAVELAVVIVHNNTEDNTMKATSDDEDSRGNTTYTDD